MYFKFKIQPYQTAASDAVTTVFEDSIIRMHTHTYAILGA